VNSGKPCHATDFYRAFCGCGVTINIAKGAPFPDCPICMRPTRWIVLTADAVKSKGHVGSRGESPRKRPAGA
jgi:hypothetical protein